MIAEISRPTQVPNIVTVNAIRSTADLAAAIDTLVDAWCDRRALGALRQILGGWPSPVRLTDDWAELRKALRNVLGVARRDLTAAEIETIQDAVAAIDDAIRNANGSPAGDIPAR